MSGSFTFDVNRCTGCGACRVACTIENGLAPDVSWRRIETYNPRHHPIAPVFHLSLACNHCQTAACMNACPALAYRRDAETGAVLLDGARCIGCGYCAWACPYDAPVMDQAAGVMTKCTWCADRLRAGLKPACTVHCPTGALDYTRDPMLEPIAVVEGVPVTALRPRLRVVGLQAGRERPQMMDLPTDHTDNPDRITPHDRGEEIGLRREWPLAVFTLAVALLVALIAASAWGAVKPNPWGFVVPAVVAMGIANLHLGRKERAWRAVLNVRRSWLSREVVLFSAFAFVSAVWLWSGEKSVTMGWTAAGLGFAALFSADMLYRVLPGGLGLSNSAGVTYTALMMAGAFVGEPRFAAFFAGVKLDRYVRRKMRRADPAMPQHVAVVRIPLAVVGVLALVWTYWPALVLLVAGEIIDRAEYYEGLRRQTPRAEMDRALEVRLSRVPGTAPSGFRAPLKVSPAARP